MNEIPVFHINLNEVNTGSTLNWDTRRTDSNCSDFFESNSQNLTETMISQITPSDGVPNQIPSLNYNLNDWGDSLRYLDLLKSRIKTECRVTQLMIFKNGIPLLDTDSEFYTLLKKYSIQ